MGKNQNKIKIYLPTLQPFPSAILIFQVLCRQAVVVITNATFTMIIYGILFIFQMLFYLILLKYDNPTSQY